MRLVAEDETGGEIGDNDDNVPVDDNVVTVGPTTVASGCFHK